METLYIQDDKACPFCNNRMKHRIVYCPNHINLSCLVCENCNIYLYSEAYYAVLSQLANNYHRELKQNVYKYQITSDLHLKNQNEIKAKIKDKQKKKKDKKAQKVDKKKNDTSATVNQKQTQIEIDYNDISCVYLKNGYCQYMDNKCNPCSVRCNNQYEKNKLIAKKRESGAIIVVTRYENAKKDKKGKNKKSNIVSKNNVAKKINYQTTHKSPEYFAKEYNLKLDTIKNIAGRFQNKCKYMYEKKCTLYDRQCSAMFADCKYHEKFISQITKESKKRIAEQQRIKKLQDQELPQIGLKDFVVRCNVFKCMHDKHKINNIDAMINVDNDGKKELVRISAGYCPQCKVYFIMDSTYQKLKSKGIILCRVSDEKAYMKSGFGNGMRLAQESLLMQYGYNVSQIEGLSSTKRQKILAVIIDNKIMSKGEIISYLDFFIHHHGLRSNMAIAVSKWEEDREFVENYRIGEYTQFGVNAIYRR